MSLTEKKIQKIIDRRIKADSIEIIALTLKHSKNTVKKYLRQYDLLGYSNQLKNAYEYTLSPSSQEAGGSLGYYPSDAKHFGISIQSDNSSDKSPQIEEIVTLKRLAMHLIEKHNEANKKNQNLIQIIDQKNNEIGNLKGKVTHLTNEKNTLSVENQNLTRQANQRNQEIDKKDQKIENITLKNEELQDNLSEKDQFIIKIQREHDEAQQKLENDLKEAYTQFNHLNNIITKLKEENDQFKKELQRLEETLSTSWIKYGIVYVAGTVTGIFCHKKYLDIISNSTLPPSVKSEKNTGYNAIPNRKKGVIQPGILNTGRHVEIPGSHRIGIGLGPGCWSVIPTVLQRYIKQT
jgi:regulator of replication initiation timing